MGTTERRQREKQARIDTIKEVASHLFATKGYANTTTEDIAGAAELSVGTIYRFFRSKEELYYSLLEPYYEEYLERFSKIVENDKERADKSLKKLLDLMEKAYSENPEAFRLVIYYRAKEINNSFSQEKLDRLTGLMRGYLDAFEKIIARGVGQGIFRPVNPRAISGVIWSVILGIFQLEENRAYAGRESLLKPMLRDGLDTLLNGLREGEKTSS